MYIEAGSGGSGSGSGGDYVKYVTPANYFECTEITGNNEFNRNGADNANQVLFAGPYCQQTGTSSSHIMIAVFSDKYCSNRIPTLDLGYLTGQMIRSSIIEKFEPRGCTRCSSLELTDEGGRGDGDGDVSQVNGLCQSLWVPTWKCELGITHRE